MRTLHHFQCPLGALDHVGRDVLITPDTDGGKKAREDNIAARDHPSAPLHKVAGDDAEHCPEFKDIPVIPAEDTDPGSLLNHRIAFLGHGLYEGGFSTPVRPKNRHVLANPN